MWRSETMNLYSILFPRESAFDILSELGSLSCIQFEDLAKKNKHSTRLFISESKMVYELFLKLSSIENELSKYSAVKLSPFVSEEGVKDIIEESKQFMRGKNLSEFLLDTQTSIDKIVKKCDNYQRAMQGIEQKLEEGVEFVGLAEKFKEHLKKRERSRNDYLDSNIACLYIYHKYLKYCIEGRYSNLSWKL